MVLLIGPRITLEAYATITWRQGIIPMVDKKEQMRNNVLLTFLWETIMVRAVVVEAAALTSLALFLGMIAVWAHVATLML